jgi:hypothetical protein
MVFQISAPTNSPHWSALAGTVAVVLLGLVVGGCANAAVVLEGLARTLTLAPLHRRAARRIGPSDRDRRLGRAAVRPAGRRAPGWRRRLVEAATVMCGALAVAACGSTPPTSNPSTPPVATLLPQGSSGRTLTPIDQTAGAVPSEYQSDYATVQSYAQSFEATATGSAAGGSTTVGVELLAANGNAGAALLQAQTLSGVEAELDADQALGIQGVTVCLSFPLLLPSTPDSSAYLSFYEQVAQQVRARGMVLSVEENPVFSGTPLTTLPISYAGLTLSTYAAEQQEQAQLIIDDVKPEYLSLLTEPDTFSSVLHLDLDTPSTAAQVVDDELSGLNRGSTLVGAGTGTWSSPAIDQALLTTSIDYLDVHVYPLAAADLTDLQSDVAAARAAHKPLVMDETWLYKDYTNGSFGTSGTSELAGDGAVNEQKEVGFSFWESLDEGYVTAMVNYVRSQGFAYVAFFDGARCFFGYLTWTPQLDASSYQSFSQQYNQLVSADFRNLEVSGTGLSLRTVLAG